MTLNRTALLITLPLLALAACSKKDAVEAPSVAASQANSRGRPHRRSSPPPMAYTSSITCMAAAKPAVVLISRLVVRRQLLERADRSAEGEVHHRGGRSRRSRRIQANCTHWSMGNFGEDVARSSSASFTTRRWCWSAIRWARLSRFESGAPHR